MPAELDPMVGPGGERILTSRWVVLAELVAESPLHLGGAGDVAVDAPILTDRVSGRPLLPGTSLAGALRSFLADFLGGYLRANEPPEVAGLFGGAREDEEGLQSPLIVFDSRGRSAPGAPPEIRDGVALDPATGTAEEHKKFELELLPAGARFEIRFELVVPNGTSEPWLLTLLQTALAGMERGEIPLGARSTRGLGRCRVADWRARRFDLSSAEGWRAWLVSDPERPFGTRAATGEASAPGTGDLASALRSAWPELGELVCPKDQRHWFRATLHLRWPRAGLLVRSPGSGPGDPDAAHLRSGGASVLPGTSLAGAFRSRALRIARLLGGDRGAEAVETLFGPRLKGTTDPDWEPAASRLSVSEGTIPDANLLQVTRIRIDRFTGGVVDGALFDEAPAYRAATRIEVAIKNPQSGEIGLLLLVLKDLLMGDLPVGGTASVGRGVAEGTAELEWSDGGRVVWNPREPLPAKDAERLESEVNSLHRALQEARAPAQTEERGRQEASS
jgi:CRISPR/Cas system CSM-associated protein Csm3 (group 7 of RAMP superfamily)